MRTKGPVRSIYPLIKKIKVGDTVSCHVPCESYERRDPRLKDKDVRFKPDMKGTVGAVKVPYVTGDEGVFLCVDYILDERKHRCCVDYSNVIVESPEF
jgi:hypothetical protein